MNDGKTLRRVRRILTELLDSPTLGDATESVDRALDQVGYALDDLNEEQETSEDEESDE